MRIIGNKFIAAVVAVALATTMVPLLQVSPASADTGTPVASAVTDTTADDFAAGTLSTAVITSTDDGELSLAPHPNTFSDSALPSTWTTGSWTDNSATSVSNGVVKLNGTYIQSTTTYARGATLEFDANFSPEWYNHGGFTANTTLDTNNAMFSTWDGGFVITAGGTVQHISDVYLNSMHHYKIAWGTSAFTFSIDNVVVGTLNWTIASGLHTIFSDYSALNGASTFDNAMVGSNTRSATFTSRVLDGGAVSPWTADWNAALPTGTTAVVSVRGSNTGTSSWSAYKILVPGNPIGLTNRYLQYKVQLSTTSFFNLPVFKDITFTPLVSTPSYVYDTTVAQFAKGTFGTGIISDSDGGNLSQPTTGNSANFNGLTALPTTWNSTPNDNAGGWTYNNGALQLDGAKANVTAASVRGTNVDFDATFTSDAGQSGGFVLDYAGTQNAMFSTEEGGGLWIYANGTRTAISSSFLGSQHHYRVAWGTSAITYSVDGNVVGTIAWANTTTKRVTFNDAAVGGASLIVDNVALTPYTATYTYTSRTFDAGNAVNWQSAFWNANVPTGTTLTVSVRGGNSASPNTTWSAFTTLTNGGAVPLSTRYIQYKAVFTSTTPFVSASLQDISLGWNGLYVPPTTTTLPGQTTTTTIPVQVATTTAVDDVDASYGDDTAFLSATINATDGVNSGTVTFQLLKGTTAVGSPVDADVADSVAYADYPLPAGTALGSYTIKATYVGADGFKNSNGTGTLTIGKAALKIKADNKTKVVGTANPTLTATYTGFAPGDSAASLTGTLQLATTATQSSGVGSYPITVSGQSSDNYDITYVNGTLSVTKTVLHVKADDKTQVYGSARPSFTASYSGFIDGDTAAALGGSLTFTTAATGNDPVGNYLIEASGLTSSKYSIVYDTGVLSITKASATVRVNDASKVYGTTNPDFAVSVDGLVNGDTAAVLGTPVFTTDATPASGVGSYAIHAAALASDNYNITYVDGSLNVTPAHLTVRADNKSKIFGAAVPGLTYTFDGFVNGDTVAAISTMPVISTDATYNSAAGSYAIRVNGAAAANYDFTYMDGTLTVGKSLLTIKVDDSQKTYGNANPSFTASYNGLVNGDGPSALNGALVFTTDATDASGVGSYAVHVSGLSSDNYDIVFVDGTLTVGKAVATVTVDNSSKIYGAQNPAFTVSVAGLANGDSLGTPVFSTDATASSSVGTYAVRASGLASDNYDINYVDGSLSINKAALTVTANDASKVYGTADPAFSARYDGLVNGDTAATLNGTAVFALVGDGVNVGDYPLHVSGLLSDNYDITFVDGKLSITPADVTVTVNNATKIYGNDNPAFSVTTSGLVSGDSLGTPVFATTADKSSTVGTYIVSVSGLSNSNYTIHTVDGTLSVTPAALTITADNKFMKYGTNVPGLTATYDGFVNGDSVTSLDSVGVLSTDAVNNSGVGSYVIHAPLASSKNYDITYVDGTLTIGQAIVTVTVDNSAKVYGAENPAFTVSFDGLVNGDAPAVLGGALNFTTDATAASGVGSYAVHAAGLTSRDYDIHFVDGTLAVTAAPVTVTVNDSSKIYGQSNPAFSVVVNGLVNGDTLAAPVFSTTADTTSAAGTYAVLASGMDDANYDITYVSGLLTITKANLTITANDATKAYGAAVPALSARVDGLVNGDSAPVVVVSTNATAASNVGDYVNTVTPISDANYDITFVNGTLSVTPVTATVTVDDATKVYGSDNPAFSISVNGLVNGDAASALGTAVFSTPATKTSNVGDYPISVNGLASPNYVITTANGTLHVTPAALTITADNKFKTFGTATPALTATYDGFVNGDGPSSLNMVSALSTNAAASSGAGMYVIYAPVATNPNYVITSVNGTLTVGTAVLTISVDNSTKTYGSANPSFTATYDGFVNGDGPSSLRGVATFTTTATAASPVGSYKVSVSGLASASYDIRFVDGSLAVNAAPLTIKATDATKVYGAVNPAFANTVTGLVNGDQATVITGTPAYSVTGTNVGSYPITVSGLSAANYNVTFAPGTLTITPAALTATANNATRTYGAADPAFSLTYSGFVNGDTTAVVSGGTVKSNATATSKVGNYVLTGSGATAANYAITYAIGTLAITPAPLTITADNKTKVAGEANPALTATMSGFVNGEAASALTGTLSLTTTATTASAEGSYPITASGLSSTNYKITYVQGTLTVTAPPVDDSDSDDTKDYIKSLDALYRWFGGYSLTRQQVDCKTGKNIGTALNVQSRNSAGVLTVNFDFSNVVVGTCWRLILTTNTPKLVFQSNVIAVHGKNLNSAASSSNNGDDKGKGKNK